MYDIFKVKKFATIIKGNIALGLLKECVRKKFYFSFIILSGAKHLRVTWNKSGDKKMQFYIV